MALLGEKKNGSPPQKRADFQNYSPREPFWLFLKTALFFLSVCSQCSGTNVIRAIGHTLSHIVPMTYGLFDLVAMAINELMRTWSLRLTAPKDGIQSSPGSSEILPGTIYVT